MSSTATGLEGNHEAVESCKDTLRYKLVGENGRYRFESVHFAGRNGCVAAQLAHLASLIEGKWLDEIDIEEICRQECRKGRAVGCPGEVARMIMEMRGILAGEQVE